MSSTDPNSSTAPPSAQTSEQRRLLRCILLGFCVVVVLLPLAGLGGAWTWALVPLLVVGAASFGAALKLRRLMRKTSISGE